MTNRAAEIYSQVQDEMNTLISIIVPVYKVEDYINDCIKSILNQTYKQWELILVDDGSPDKCGQICDEIASHDARIKVIHKRNGGLSDARNAGLDVIKGQYVTFVDSDDVIAEEFLEDMKRLAQEYDADIVQCDFTKNVSDLGKINVKSETIQLNGSSEIIKEFLTFGAPKVHACGKIYKSSLFKDLRFPVGKIDEDNFTTYKALSRSSTFINENKYLYYYRVNPESITHRSFNAEKFGILNCIPEMRSFFKVCRLPVDSYLNYYEMRQLVQVYNKAVMANAEEAFSQELNSVKKRLNEVCRKHLKMDLKYRIITNLIRYCEPVYKKIVKRVKRVSGISAC